MTSNMDDKFSERLPGNRHAYTSRQAIRALRVNNRLANSHITETPREPRKYIKCENDGTIQNNAVSDVRETQDMV